MPKHHRTKSGDPIVKQGMIAESNPLSYETHGRNVESDYYRLENRKRQLDAIASLTAAEYKYVTGEDATLDGTRPDKSSIDKVRNSVERLHELDLLELKCLIYLQKLPDSSPELFTLKAMCGCDSREQIAAFIAEKQMKKLIMSQVELIAGGQTLTDTYKTIIKQGPTAFGALFA